MRRLWRWIKTNALHGWQWGEDHSTLSLTEKIRLYIKERAGDD